MMQRGTQFPNRLYHFIWRNWDIVSAERLGRFLGVPVKTVRGLAHDLGLTAQPDNLLRLRSRYRSLVIRRNWHLLPMRQIERLVGMTAPELGKFMRDDDFLNHKLPPKPRCGPLRYRTPPPAQRRAARQIGEVLSSIAEPERPEATFAFLDSLRRGRIDVSPPRVPVGGPWAMAPRIMHPFDMPHNLSAFDPENTPVPYLSLMSQFGVDALWVPVVVSDLVRLLSYPEFGTQRNHILPNLRSLIRRAERANVKIYLYICEPRAQLASFFQRRPQIRGAQVKGQALYHICTSTPEGQALVRDSIRELCRSLPGLAGLIDICASEYPTHCWSHGQGQDCRRCGKRRPADVVAELLRLMQEGVEASGRNVELIAWNWGWQWILRKRKKSPSKDITRLNLARDAREYIFRKLPRKVTPLLNFEYGTRVRRGGTENRVWEYCMSQPRQGPFTAVQKRSLNRLGRDALARIHISNSTEFLGAPYIPALHLVAEKISDVRAKGYKGFMGSWIFGGYPSPNLLVARELSRGARPDNSKALQRVAALYYGRKNVARVVQAWGHFSRAFRHYPFSIPFQYSSPLHIAPAAEWPLKPSGQRSLMYCPSDDPKTYCAPYDPETVYRVFTRITSGWEKGLTLLRSAFEGTDRAHRPAAERDYGVAEAIWLCCSSLLNHIRFCSVREHSVRSRSGREKLRALIMDELRLAERYYCLIRSDSRLAFEASMQYFILPNDAREKILGLHGILKRLDRLDKRSR